MRAPPDIYANTCYGCLQHAETVGATRLYIAYLYNYGLCVYTLVITTQLAAVMNESQSAAAPVTAAASDS